MMTPFYVVSWKWEYGTGNGIIQIFRHEAEAVVLLNHLNQHGDPGKTFSLTKHEVCLEN